MTTPNLPQCIICFDDVVKSKEVSCPKCQMTICKSCTQQWLLSKREVLATCPNPECKVGWNMETVYTMIGSGFTNGAYSKMRAEVLKAQQMSLMAESQNDASKEMIRRSNKKIIEKMSISVRRWKSQIREADECMQYLHMGEPPEKYTARLEKAREFGVSIWRIVDSENEQNEIDMAEAKSGAPAKGPRKLRLKYGCAHGSCRGFISDMTYECGICRKITCPKCQEAKANKNDPDHICDPDKVASVDLLKASVKCCPNGHPAVRIAGCPQMFCPVDGCHALWDYNTGKFVSGMVHNPDALNFIRDQGIQVNQGGLRGADAGCGLPRYYAWNRKMESFFGYRDTRRQGYIQLETDKYSDASLYSIVSHIRGHMCEGIRHRLGQDDYCGSARVSYLVGDIDEKQFESLVKKREKRVQKDEAILHQLETFVSVGTDILRAHLDCESKEEWIALSKNLEKLCQYFNKQMNDRVTQRFKSMGYSIAYMTPKDSPYAVQKSWVMHRVKSNGTISSVEYYS